jgi:ferric-dicitrate binding protein FerR (iron transport regulator)
MSNPKELLQERLEHLEMGGSLEECIAGLSADEAELLKLAAGLREMEYPEQSEDSAAAQRTAVLELAQERMMNDKVARKPQKVVPWRSWPRWLVPATVFSGAGALVSVCMLVIAIAAGVVWWSGQEAEVVEKPAPAAISAEAPPGEDRHEFFLPLVSRVIPLTPETARVEEVRGIVEVQAEDNTWSVVAATRIIGAGQRVRTGALSGARLVFYDGSQVSLGPDTEVSVDRLDARTDGSRVVVLDQWIGETVHDVVPATAADSHYEVHTPSAVGAARGTVFQVLVTPDQVAHFSVEEGAVAVTGVDATVVVDAGQLTTVGADGAPEEPAFRITGEGQVSQIGAVWVIAGQSFETHDGTVVVGNPQVGDWVFVRGRLLADNTRIADWITLLRRSPANRFILSGKVEALDSDTWTVAGQTIMVTDETDMDDDIEVGDLVRVEGVILPEGELKAERIVRIEDAPGQPFEFRGVVQAIADMTWTISSVAITVDDETEIAAGLAVGDLVHVRGWILEDGTWLASAIERVGDEEPAFEFTGAIESIDPWVIAGIAFETREWTEIEPGLEVGDLVRVEGRIMEDGTWVAFEIERLDEEEMLHIVLVGTVTSIDPWIVSGIPFVVDGDTVIVGEITVGMLVRVEIAILPDGTWRVVEIKPFQGFGWGLGCLTFSGVVVSIDGDQLQLVDWPLLTLDDDVVIEDGIAPGSVVVLQICFADDGTLSVAYIIIIHTPEPVVIPPIEPPSGGGGRVTICHKPKGKNPHTITVAESAVQVHLDHGDTLGPCPGGE